VKLSVTISRRRQALKSVSRSIPEDRPSEQELLKEFDDSEIF
jgi:hypothetical protein